jgi:hypothetical protein
MTDTSDERSRPTPRPRSGGPQRSGSTPRPRIAGSRRDRDTDPVDRTGRPAPAPRPHAAGHGTGPADRETGRGISVLRNGGVSARRSAATPAPSVRDLGRRRRRPVAALVLTVLCLLTAAGGGWLLWGRLHPGSVDPAVFTATRSSVQALYAFDYKNPDASIKGKLAVLTGNLRSQYDKDLKQGGIIDTYKQVSATTRYDVLDVGLQQINDAQDTATLVVFGQYLVKSANSGSQPAPQGSECTTTTDGAQSCTQTLQVRQTKVDGAWKISDLTLLTTS